MVDEVKNECPTFDIAAYIDGELTPPREMEMDVHFAACGPCRLELNEQKRFLRELEASLHDERQLQLPANFTKLVVTNAESSVSGLRRPGERFNAVFICVSLMLFVLFATGAESQKAISGLTNLADQSVAVAGFFGHLIYSLFLGIVIILRTLGSQGAVDSLAILAIFSVSVVTLTVLSKRVLRIGRA